VKIHHSKPSSRFTVIPNEVLQDQRLTFTARGILGDILSRPQDWQTTCAATYEAARRARPEMKESRRDIERAWAQLKEFGYMTTVVTKGSDGTCVTELHVYDTPGHGVDRRTNSGMPVVTSGNTQTPSSDRHANRGESAVTSEDASQPRSDRHTTVGTPIQRNRSTKKQNKEPGQTAAAVLLGADDADASPGRGKPQPSATESSTTSANPSRASSGANLKLRLRNHLAVLGDDHVLDIHDKLIYTRTIRWARREAVTELGLPFAAVREDSCSGDLTTRAVEIALLALSKDGGIPAEASELLGDWEWPKRRLPKQRKEGPAAKARKSLPWVEYYRPPAGTPDVVVRKAMYAEVDALEDGALYAKLEQLRDYRPGDSKEYEARARTHFAKHGHVPTEQDMARCTIKAGILHFSGKWPMFVDPLAPVPGASSNQNVIRLQSAA
jgi:hypothetical protein